MFRTKIGKYYVKRTNDGRFKEWDKISRSLKQDRRKKSSTIPSKKRQGYKGDY